MAASFAFVGEPETNGVAERFFRTFKEPVVHRRIYQIIVDVRAAVRKFFELYNAQWLIEKHGLRSPRQTHFAFEKVNMRHARLNQTCVQRPGRGTFEIPPKCSASPFASTLRERDCRALMRALVVEGRAPIPPVQFSQLPIDLDTKQHSELAPVSLDTTLSTGTEKEWPS